MPVSVPRILAVDWGERRIGLAVSDPHGIIATGLETLVVRGAADAVTRVAKVAAEREAEPTSPSAPSRAAEIAPVGLRQSTRVPRPASATSMFVRLQAPPST